MALEFLDLLSTIPDRRRPQGRKWRLGPALLATILAVLSGANSYRKVHGFIEARLDVLNTAFGFGWKAAPAYSTLRTILHGLDAADVEHAFRAHAASLSAPGADEGDIERTEVVAVDGKTLRGQLRRLLRSQGGACAERVCDRERADPGSSGDE